MVVVAEAAAMRRAVCQPRNALGAVPGLPSAPCPAGGGQAPVHAGELCQPRPRGLRAILAGAQRARGPSCPGSGGRVPAAPGITTATTAGPSTQKLKKKIKLGGLYPHVPSMRPGLVTGLQEPPQALAPSHQVPVTAPPAARGVPLSSPRRRALQVPREAEAFKMAAAPMGKARHRVTGASSCRPKGELVPEPGSAPKEKARATSPKHQGEPSRAGGHLLR